MDTIKDGCVQGQSFASNPARYAAIGTPGGHPGIDRSCGYGSPVYSPVSGIVYSMHTPSRPASDGYTAVYLLCRTKLEWFEFAIGHLSEISVQIGQQVAVGDLIGKEGNKGIVYSGGVRITLAMQAAGNRDGSHRHYQKRVVNRVLRPSWLVPSLRTARGPYTDTEGYRYQWALPNNRLASCVNPLAPLFPRTLSRGMEGYDVLLLQRAIGIPATQQALVFGPKTENALKSWQSDHGFQPVGIAGPQTRSFLNSRYGQLVDP